MMGYEKTYDMVKDNIQLQTQVRPSCSLFVPLFRLSLDAGVQITITLFAGLCFFVAVICAVILMMKKPSAGQAPAAFEMKAQPQV